MRERPQLPLPGDIHLLREYPPGTNPQDITDFEVWDGARWVHAQERVTYSVEQV